MIIKERVLSTAGMTDVSLLTAGAIKQSGKPAINFYDFSIFLKVNELVV